ncbi:hypothetical protein [Streptomyces incarnatus]|uniref:hypothetical protein n=1 Tax=Streptomyces incarnatus TaxID=665007 RepID=UPI000AFCA594|nr:hypothetical protein [Streptomyces incarnatus]
MITLNSQFQGSAVTWLAVSSLVGALVGATVKFAFEDLLRPWAGVHYETRKILNRYSTPLARSAESLERRINLLVRNEEKNWLREDEYTLLSSLYAFGEYLCWIRIIEREFGFLPFEVSRRGRLLNHQMHGIFRALTSHGYFKSCEDQDAVGRSAVPRLMLSAVGEAMIKDSSPLRPIDFTEFVIRYRVDDQFSRWFKELSDVITAAHPENPLNWDRIIAAGAHLRVLIRLLDPKGVMVEKRAIVNLERASEEVRQSIEREFPEFLPQKPSNHAGRLHPTWQRARVPKVGR